ncbi:armadillo repeat-containing protein 2-like [Orbicella faveolata]|uniref:armadillo repeat-containing protein 2-like n=1 Tax=Orbicella faveolata TaxID=48498 RepID=UPI0009E51A5A|nr:armadillo repeat-containing protein 2-like [Orbicella faveolata]
MDPPRPQKSRRGEKASNRPFYATEGPTSANIVADARSSIRPLDTKRPFTPVESNRTLFGRSSVKPYEGRPPSAFSLGSYQSEGETSRPPSGRRLTPIENAPQIPEAVVPSPPSGVPSGKVRRPLKSSLSGPFEELNAEKLNQKLHNIVIGQQDKEARAELPPCPPKSSSFSGTPPSVGEPLRHSSSEILPAPPAVSRDVVGARRVRSGPKERSTPVVDSITRVKSGPLERGDPAGIPSEQTASETSPTSGRTRKKGGERGGSGDKRRKKSQAEEDKPKDELVSYYEDHVKPLLSQMEERFAEKNVKDLCQDCLKLWNALEKKGLMGKASGSFSARRRGEILRTVFKFLDLSDPRLLLRLGRLILSMKVTGNNLTNICMVMYRVAKTEKNDQLFLEEDILKCLVDTIGSCEIGSHHDALVYTAGALKHLSSNNPTAQKELVSLQGIEGLAQILDAISKDVLMSMKGNSQFTSLLVQVTGALRNLADVTGARELFVSTGVVRNLAIVLGPYSSDGDVVWNVCRALSKLTLYTECCGELLDSDTCTWLQALSKILSGYEKKQELVVRVCFILGNLTSKSEKVRETIFFDESFMAVLLSVMQSYFNTELEVLKNGPLSEEKQVNGEKKGPNKNEDVLIKAIRVVANLSISPEAGAGLAANEALVDLLIQILDVKDATHSEELVLNTVATLNNLSFYNDVDSVVQQRQVEITEMLISLLMPENMDAMVEACRVFGNFSRSKEVRALLAEHKVDEIMIALLDAGERETVFIACGVLINLMIDEHIKPKLKEEDGIKKLVDVLRDFGKHDWQLSSMVCQILWNYSDKITSSSETFGDQETLELMDVLTQYLDEDIALDPSELESMESSLPEVLRDMWEGQFVPVGQHLLQRVKSHHTDLVPLESPS